MGSGYIVNRRIAPDLEECIEGFWRRHTIHTLDGRKLNVSEQYLQKFAYYLLMGPVLWMEESSRIRGEGGCLLLGEFLDRYVDRYPCDSNLVAAMQVTHYQMVGMGMHLSRALAGLLLSLDQNHERFDGFNDVVQEKGPGLLKPFSEKLIVRAL